MVPGEGFIPHRWDSYSELMGLYLLGIGAPGQALPAETWHAWRREPRAQHDGRTFIQCGPLFTHQYAHGWFDFRNQRDAYADLLAESQWTPRSRSAPGQRCRRRVSRIGQKRCGA
jgi:hypothetical protein